MGNVSSSSDSDEELHVEYKQDEENLSDNEADLEKDNHQAVDLGGLFEPASLRAAAARVRDEMPDNVIQQHHSTLVRWLEERLQRNEETVTLAQFCDMLMGRSVGRDDCIQVFQPFDSEGDGSADVTAMMEALKASQSASLYGELAYVVRTLQACSLIPGFIDVYIEDKQAIGQHGTRILNFLMRNRAPSSLLPFPTLNGFANTMAMRLSAAQNIFNRMKETANRQHEENLLSSGEELKPITKCYKSIEASSNRSDVHRLSNTDPSSYWQSDGSARSHWLRLRMRNNVVIKQLSFSVASSDQSYMPQTVSISVGKNSHSLREIKEIRIPSHITGDVVLWENAKTFYPVVQLNIKRCHSDGCDTRIHNIKTLGYRVVKEAGVSVMDASAAWYLQILAATTAASLPVCPQLRANILQQTRVTLQHMPPLSLCPSSAERPQFLSPHVLKQMDAFLSDVSFHDQSVSQEGLYVLLAFNLARGHVAGTMKALLGLQENPHLELEAASLLKNLNAVRDVFWKKQGGSLPMTLAGCDGGQKEETSGPSNVLSSNWTTSQAYLSGDGKTLVNIFFKAQDHIQPTKLRIKVDKGPRGAKRGMVFVYKDGDRPFELKEHVARFKDYDSWTLAEYNLCCKVRTSGIGGKADNPVAYFTLEDDWDEVEVVMDVSPVGQYILVKFLEPRQSSAERLGIVGVKFQGFSRKSVFVDDTNIEKLAPLPEKESVGSEVVFLRCLDFLVSLSRDQVPVKKLAVFNKPQSLDMSDLTVDLIWKLYNGFSNRHCQCLTLQMLHSLFPFFSMEANKNASETLFRHLCGIVDNTDTSEDIDKRVVTIAKQVIIDGAAVFFPDKEARRKQLFNMMSDVGATADAPSVSLTFQSLCQFFSSVDPSGLLDLPQNIEKEFNPEPVLAVMDTLVSVSYLEFRKVLDTVSVTEQSSHLVHLLCSLQTSLMGWCYRQILADNKDHAKVAQGIIVKYTTLLITKATAACKDFQRNCTEWMTTIMPKLDGSFLSTCCRQLVLIFLLISEHLDSTTRVQLLHILMPLVKELHKIAPQLPDFFYKVDSSHWKQMVSGEVVLRTWDVESPHNYENNQHTTQIFSCPGAATFIVEFDPRCETEKRYDYLEFTDSNGVKTRFDQKIGTEKWTPTVTFKGGHRLQFLFHSDSSNNAWGYKFKVIAKGCPDVPLCWMYDLQLAAAKLCGRFCGTTLDTQKAQPKLPTDNQDEESETEQALLKSELWTTLFRGGYHVGKLQRSLSGKHVAIDESKAGTFLWSMVEETTGSGADFLKRVRLHCNCQVIGGEDVTEAVTATFAALIWHTQALREEVDKYAEFYQAKLENTDCIASSSAKSDGEYRIPEGVYQAYTVAEGLRSYLMEQRQKQKVAAEKDSSKKDDLNLVSSCREKALFLLMFAGLSKVHIKPEVRGKVTRQASRFSRLQSITGEKAYKLDSALEKFPSFRLVLEFVRDPAWSKLKVEELLKQRSCQAQAIAEVYMLTAEYIRIHAEEHIFQVPTVHYLQEMLSYQQQFAKHYADGLDGCGLAQETKIRQAYYALIRRLLDSIRQANRLKIPKEVLCAYDYIQACTLHLLDVNWQLYDLSFLEDVKMPEFYMKLAKGSVSMREKAINEIKEEDELTVYERDMKNLEECKKGFMDWYDRHDKASKSSKEEKKATQMFVAKFCDLLDVEISCDGCGVTLPGRRYRCLQCQDMDLCATCYAGGVKPGGEHADDHEIIHMMFKCDECQAFIVGKRIHCNVCEDFDLCLGCHKKAVFPAGHNADHNVTEVPMIKWKLNKDSDTSLQSYLHQHVWLQFSALSLSMTNLMYHGDRNLMDTDPDYSKACTHLHNQCIELAKDCLMQVTTNRDLEDDDSPESLATCREAAFALHSQERIMGLLGAMIPPENKAPISENVNCTFTSEEFLQLLFTIARGESGHETNTQHLAMGLIGQLLQRTNTNLVSVDAAVAMATGESIAEDLSEGLHTAQFLFTFGASCLERSGLEWANSMASILQQLFNSQCWCDVLRGHLTLMIQSLQGDEEKDPIPWIVTGDEKAESAELFKKLDTDSDGLVSRLDVCEELKTFGVDTDTMDLLWTMCDVRATVKLPLDLFCIFLHVLKKKAGGQELPNRLSNEMLPLQYRNVAVPKEPKLSSIFALFVIAGFPEVLSIGCHVQYTEGAGMETKEGVVLKHFPDKNMTLLVDKKSRKRVTVKDERVECVSPHVNILDDQHIAAFSKVIKNIACRIRTGERVGVECMWVLSLSLKSLLKTIKGGSVATDGTTSSCSSSSSLHRSNSVYRELFQPEFVQCVVHLASQATGFSRQWMLKDLEILSLMLYTRDREKTEELVEPAVKEGDAKDAAKDPSADGEDSLDPWVGLDDTARLCFQTLHEHLSVPVSLLRAMYDMLDQSTDDLLFTVHNNMDGERFTPPEGITELAKKWERATSQESTSSVAAAELAADKALDSGMQLSPSPAEQEKQQSCEKAVDEPAEDSQRLIIAPDNDLRNDVLKQRKTKSTQLMKIELERQGKTGSRDFLIKVNLAMSVLYARQVLTSLLADWPSTDFVITAQLIGCMENRHVPYVLDLLNRSESRDTFKKVVQNVIKHCDPECLVPIAMTATQFMNEVNLSTVVKESNHPYKNNTNFEDKVHVAGATSLFVKFDNRCCTEDSCDELVMASSADFTQDKHIFSGSRDRWTDFELPGDTVYYKFFSDCSTNDWGYKFTVTGGKLGRFDTGYMILNSVLSLKEVVRQLPVVDLWNSLVYVACRQTGQQRLKALQLLLKIMQAQFKDAGTESLTIDLSQLKPLWELYNKLSQDNPEPGSIILPVVRALTEFFLVSENLALDQGVSREYMASLLSTEEVHELFYQGALNVAAVGVMINHPNKATEAFQALKEKTKKDS